MKFLLFYCLIKCLISVACSENVKREIWYQWVNGCPHPVQGNAYIPQVFPLQMGPYNPYHWPNIRTDQVSRLPEEKTHVQHSQNENVGNPLRPCSENEFQCTSPKQCVLKTKRCNNYLDCIDASDEIGCNCTSRLPAEKICDFYDDCPNSEDELGCFGCGMNEHHCFQSQSEKDDLNSKHCYNATQICNKEQQCPNGKDESNCYLLLKEIPSSTDMLFSLLPMESGVLCHIDNGTLYPMCEDKEAIRIMVCNTILQENSWGQTLHNESTTYTGMYSYAESKIGPPTFKNSCTNSSEAGNVVLQVNCLRKVSCTAHFDEVDTSARIAGGYGATPGSNPWLVGLFVNGYFRCGGSIIGRKWILTAAHCLYDEGKPFSIDHYVEVRAGLHRQLSFSPDEQVIRVARGKTHKFNRQTYENDIALLELESSLSYNKFVQPICLPTDAHVGPINAASWIWGPKIGTVCKTAGWGRYTQHGYFPHDSPNEVYIPISSTCEPRNPKVVCAGYDEGGFDACVGDSGGGLVCTSAADPSVPYLAGIVSSGYNPTKSNDEETRCGEKGWYGTYTRLPAYTEWVQTKKHRMTQNATYGTKFRQLCPDVICSTPPKRCAVRDGIVGCIDGQDEQPDFN